MKKPGHYFQVGERPHTCRDGRKVTLFVWMGFCRACGQPFEVTTLPPDADGHIRTKSLARVHCDAHKRGRRGISTPPAASVGTDHLVLLCVRVVFNSGGGQEVPVYGAWRPLPYPFAHKRFIALGVTLGETNEH